MDKTKEVMIEDELASLLSDDDDDDDYVVESTIIDIIPVKPVTEPTLLEQYEEKLKKEEESIDLLINDPKKYFEGV
jgi:hypothetical protein